LKSLKKLRDEGRLVRIGPPKKEINYLHKVLFNKIISKKTGQIFKSAPNIKSIVDQKY